MINLTLTRSAFSAAEVCVWGGGGQVAGEICELWKKIFSSVTCKSQSLGKNHLNPIWEWKWQKTLSPFFGWEVKNRWLSSSLELELELELEWFFWLSLLPLSWWIWQLTSITGPAPSSYSLQKGVEARTSLNWYPVSQSSCQVLALLMWRYLDHSSLLKIPQVILQFLRWKGYLPFFNLTL